MAKKSAAGNKSQAIRDALAANPDKSPKEIAELVAADGHKVTPAYVSIVKYNQSKAGGKGDKKVVVRRKVGGPGRRAARAGASHLGAMEAAIAFVRAAGGIEQAKQTLAVLESIRSVL